ncbi:MAG: PQQ-dependent sugar dehydrogenase [Anaerolineae bacterium]|nr:PQQ-dependent sugar dehydrogenase [Thermoflexales bacterium]MDW8407113.1 PQQ-dependent sugar dehydrogenase [Anaerolineae bacterium]
MNKRYLLCVRIAALCLAAVMPACAASPAPNATPVTGAPRPIATPSPQSATPLAASPVAPTPTPLPQSEAVPPLPNVMVEPIVDGLERPTYLTAAGDGSGRLYVTEQPGRVRVIEQGQLRPVPVLDIVDRVGSGGDEQGLLSIAFSPTFVQDRLLYVNYTDRNGATVVSRFTVSPDGLLADPATEQLLLTIDQPYANHNGGQLQFGPDGMLYIGTGDGGSAGDPQNYAQNITSLLGKMLRIDVKSAAADRPYAIPSDNPDFGAGAPPELWAIGLRNPWRFSFDRLTGDLYIADVGQNAFEEINFQPASSRGGENYGWRLREGFAAYRGGQDSPALTAPIYQYDHELGCSVTGGYVYRGSAIPALVGRYIYGDYCSGTIWALHRNAAGEWINETLLESDMNISSFGEDEAGELYVVHHGGAIARLAPDR